MNTMDALASFETVAREVVRKALPDGASLVLYSSMVAPTWRIERVERADGAVAEVFSTGFKDEASSVFDAYDGIVRNWHAPYLPIGKLPPDRADLTVPVHAAGVTVEACLEAFLSSIGETLSTRGLHVEAADPDPRFGWSAAFVSEPSGTGFKAAGRHVPGGMVMTWWK